MTDLQAQFYDYAQGQGFKNDWCRWFADWCAEYMPTEEPGRACDAYRAAYMAQDFPLSGE